LRIAATGGGACGTTVASIQMADPVGVHAALVALGSGQLTAEVETRYGERGFGIDNTSRRSPKSKPSDVYEIAEAPEYRSANVDWPSPRL